VTLARAIVIRCAISVLLQIVVLSRECGCPP
jgi:hypothetical protein